MEKAFDENGEMLFPKGEMEGADQFYTIRRPLERARLFARE